MKKKVLPVIVAILLILVIGGCALGKVLLDKYSYSKEEADWNEFYQVSENDRSAIILQNEMVEEQALIKDGVCYFDLATVHKYMKRSILCGYDRESVVICYSDRSDPDNIRRDCIYDNGRNTGSRLCDQLRGRR